MGSFCSDLRYEGNDTGKSGRGGGGGGGVAAGGGRRSGRWMSNRVGGEVGRRGWPRSGPMWLRLEIGADRGAVVCELLHCDDLLIVRCGGTLLFFRSYWSERDFNANL